MPLEKRDELSDEFRDWQMLEDDDLPSYVVGDWLDSYWGNVAKMRDATVKVRYEQLCKLTKALLTIPCSNAGSRLPIDWGVLFLGWWATFWLCARTHANF